MTTHEIPFGQMMSESARKPWGGLREDITRAPRVVVIECNPHMAEVLARQVEEVCVVEAIPWTLADPAELPPLPIIGTYFHHPEIRRRWHAREDDMHFVALQIDAGLKGRIEATARDHGRFRLTLVEQGFATARALAQDVAELLGSEFVVEPASGDPNVLLESLEGDELLLVGPRVWKDLAREHRENPRVFDICPIIGPTELEGVVRWLRGRASEVECTDDREP
jgi:hypothetical protein